MIEVTRDELLSLDSYEKLRPARRAEIIELKQRRRVSVGPSMTLLFENHDTVLSQFRK